MTDILLQIGVSNVCVSLVLALAAWVVQESGKRPLLAHLLWLLVLAKLVTPPLFTLPLIDLSGTAATAAALPLPSGASPAAGAVLAPEHAAFARDSGAASAAGDQLLFGLMLLWVIGSAWVFGWSLWRIGRFNRLLGMSSEPAPRALQDAAAKIAKRLQLRTIPTIHTTSAHVSPMVWWIGRGVRIILPAALSRQMNAAQVRWVLAHELAHVRRRDHIVRWLEWLACVCFWWNPVAWWARRNLRVNEEICCDALVLESLQPDRQVYASSLLSVVEFLAAPALRPPAMASRINGGGFLERRFEMIVSTRPLPRTPRWLRASILICAAGLLPLGLAHAQGKDYKAVAAQIKASLEEGKITAEQAEKLVAETGAQLRVAVAAGEMTAEEAKAILAALRGAAPSKSKAMSREELMAVAEKIKKAVAAGELTEEEARMKLVALRQQFAERGPGAREEYAAVATRLKAAVKAGKLTEEEAKEKLEGYRRRMAASAESKQSRLEDHFESLGLDAGALDRIRGALTKRGGLQDEQVEQALGAMARIIPAMTSATEAYELDPKLRAYLQEQAGLTGEQIELVTGLAQRVASRLSASEREATEGVDWDAIKRRIEGAVERGDLTREEADAKYAAIKKRLAKDKRKGV